MHAGRHCQGRARLGPDFPAHPALLPFLPMKSACALGCCRLSPADLPRLKLKHYKASACSWLLLNLLHRPVSCVWEGQPASSGKACLHSLEFLASPYPVVSDACWQLRSLRHFRTGIPRVLRDMNMPSP